MIGGTALISLTCLAYLWAPPFWPLFIVRALQGVSIAFFFTASFTLIANISPEDRRGQSLSLFYLSLNVAFALAPSLGMWLINLFDFTALFIVCSGLSVCSLVITSRLTKMQGVPLDDLPLEKQPFLSREVLPPAIMALLVNIIWGALTTFFPLYAISQGVSNPGLFFAAYALMLILGRGFGGKVLDLYADRRERLIFPCLGASIISMPILAFSKTLPMFLLVALIWGAGGAFLYPTLIAHALDRAGSARGPAMGTFTAVADLGTGMGSVIMGIILTLTNYRTMFLCLAATGVINLLYFRFSLRKKGGMQHANL